MIQVHFWGKPDWSERLKASVADVANCAFGEDVATDTQVLIKGRPTEAELDQLQNLIAVVIPFAGIPVQTRELLADHTGIQLYNLHHNAADTAEMAIALFMAAAKHVTVRDQGLRMGKWSEGSFMRSGTG